MGLPGAADGARLPGQSSWLIMDGLFNGLTVIDVDDDAYRNIVSLRESEDLFDDLTSTRKGWKAAIELELATKPLTYQSNQPIIDRPFEEATYNEAIEYPYSHWSKTRYSDGSFGVWYGADSLATGIYESVYHWHQLLLKDAGWHALDDVYIERKVFQVRCTASLLNFIPKLDAFPALVDPVSYHLTHQVGTRIHHEGHPGLLSRSARHEGKIYAIFNSHVLTNPRTLCYLTYRTQTESIIVEREPGEVLLKIAYPDSI